MFKKPPRSLFKINKIGDWHWSLLIPIQRHRKLREKYNFSMDTVVTGMYRKYFCVAVLIHGWPGFKEIRIRVGTQLL